ncbi:hypothetical protein [Salinibius halmophilus]|uniref:hypothetical protein n=1 Tax=Salinibius halmophilus TaxID=1853216 RepID=UPI000E66A825|nr:hypothetical protein [Salinibius halmophilus]
MHPLQAQFEQVNQSGYLTVSYAPKLPGPKLVDLIQSDWLEHMLQAQKDGRPNLDKRGEGAFLISRFAFLTALVVASCQLTSGQVPRLAGTSTTVNARRESIELFIASNEVLNDDIAAIRQMLIQFYQPMVERVAALTKLAPAKQWALISDALAMTWQFVGEPLGCAEKARQTAMALLTDEKSVLKNRRTSFEEYKLFASPDDSAPTIHQFIRVRAGCCRKFTDDGNYCNTCVYVPKEDRQARISETLWQNYYNRQ